MKTIEIKKIKDCKELIGTKPLKEHYSVLISEPTILTKEGVVVAVYDKITENYKRLAKNISVTTVPNKSKRQTSGVPTVSSVFGAIAKNGIRVATCRGTKRNKEEKENFAAITKLAEVVSEKYKEILPEQYKKDLQLTKNLVEADYLFGELPFTTFNANKNQLIKYHIDRGNLKGVMSNVLISRQGVSGGELVFPEYGFAFAQQDGFYSVFDGEKEVHGVADCKFISKDAYRCSFVFYTLDQMRHCAPYLEEMENEKQHYTKKNNNRRKTFGMSKKDFLSGKYNE
jgi:hypothetical protein